MISLLSSFQFTIFLLGYIMSTLTCSMFLLHKHVVFTGRADSFFIPISTPFLFKIFVNIQNTSKISDSSLIPISWGREFIISTCHLPAS